MTSCSVFRKAGWGREREARPAQTKRIPRENTVRVYARTSTQSSDTKRKGHTLTVKPDHATEGSICLSSCIFPLYSPSGSAEWASSEGWRWWGSTRVRGRFGKPTQTSVHKARDSNMPSVGNAGRALSAASGGRERLRPRSRMLTECIRVGGALCTIRLNSGRNGAGGGISREEEDAAEDDGEEDTEEEDGESGGGAGIGSILISRTSESAIVASIVISRASVGDRGFVVNTTK